MKNTLETRLGIFFALAIVAAVILLEVVGGLEFFKGGYHIRARFNTIQELKRGDPVKMAGVDIGRVDSIHLTNQPIDQVVVVMKIQKGVAVSTDSKATIRFTGLLGQNFVAIGFGTSKVPVDPSANAELATEEQPDLSTLMAKVESMAGGFERLSQSITPDKIDNLFGALSGFLKENNAKFGAILGNMQTISGHIAGGKGTVGRLIMEDPPTLYLAALNAVTNLQETAAEVKLTVAKASTIVDEIKAGQGTIGALLKERTLHDETTLAMTNLKEILQKINQGQGFAGQLVNDQTLFKNLKMTLQKVEKATEGLEDQGPISVMSILVNPLF